MIYRILDSKDDRVDDVDIFNWGWVCKNTETRVPRIIYSSCLPPTEVGAYGAIYKTRKLILIKGHDGRLILLHDSERTTLRSWAEAFKSRGITGLEKYL